ncbi:MAG: peptidoglycan recognition family protein [Deltaproteobacteria bacterium]
MKSRSSLLLTTLTLGGLILVGCTQPPPLPPPTASIPPQSVPGLGDAGRRVPPPGIITGVPRPGSNPWKPTVAARDWKYVVIHHTATTSGSVESIHAAHLKNKDKNGNPWLGIGYHFVIGNGDGMPDGAIEPTFRWRTQIQGAHAGSSNKDYNERGVGICLVGNFEKTPPTAAQRKSVKLLVQTLRAEYKVPAANVVGHKDIRASATECPGKFFPMAEIAGTDSELYLGENSPGQNSTDLAHERVAVNTRSLSR